MEETPNNSCKLHREWYRSDVPSDSCSSMETKVGESLQMKDDGDVNILEDEDRKVMLQLNVE